MVHDLNSAQTSNHDEQESCSNKARFDYDVFIDLSSAAINSVEADCHLRLLEEQAGINFDGRRVTVVRPGTAVQEDRGCRYVFGIRGDAVGLLQMAIKDAAARRCGLAVIVGAWRPTNDSLCALADVGSLDPMIACVQPRFALSDVRSVLSLPGGPEFLLPLAALRSIPRTIVSPELVSALFILTPRALSAAPAIASDSLEHAFLELLIGLRRRGFRNVVCNRIVVPFSLTPALAYPRLESPREGAELPWQQDAVLGLRWLANMPERKLEVMLAGAYSSQGHPRLLLDCRGVLPTHNGTARAVLGFLDGFVKLKQNPFEIIVVASREGARFHGLKARFSCFEIQLDRPRGSFFAAILLSQPWSFQTITELHKLASIIVFNMLDTIAWDIIYPASDDLGRIWSTIGQIADGLLFNSKFSLDRFRFRFAPSNKTLLKVTYHSVVADEIIPKAVLKNSIEKPFLLVIGNKYDHKDVTPTLSILVQAFPSTRIVAIGIDSFPSPFVFTLESGNVDSSEIHALMANAAAIVFPSHYEGFGLPVVEGLAHGTRVIVRDSPLWEEIAKLSRRPELIVPFRGETELVDAVGFALRGLSSSAQGYTVGPSGAAPSWSDCAQRVLDLVEEIAVEADGSRWLARHALASQEVALTEALEQKNAENRLLEADIRLLEDVLRQKESRARAAEEAHVEQLRKETVRHVEQLAALQRPDNVRGRTTWQTLLPVFSRKRRKELRRHARELSLIASSPLFDAEWYLAGNPDVAAQKIAPALHYLLYGAKERRAPGPNFDGAEYQRANIDVLTAGINPLVHYVTQGRREGRPLSVHVRAGGEN